MDSHVCVESTSDATSSRAIDFSAITLIFLPLSSTARRSLVGSPLWSPFPDYFLLGLTSYSGTTFRVIIKYWHDLFLGSNTGMTFFDGSDTGTTLAFPLRWHFLFFPPPPGCHLVLLILSLSLHSLSLFISRGPPSSLIILSLSLGGGQDHRISS